MNQETKRPAVNMRPLWLTMVLCVVMLAGAADLAFGSRVIGFVALMGAAGILTVIMSTCETYISILDSLIPLIILFFAGGMQPWIPALGAVVIVCALVLSGLIKGKTAKTTAVVIITVTLLAYVLVFAAVFYVLDGNALSFSGVMDDINHVFDGIREDMVRAAQEYVDGLPQSLLDRYEALGIDKVTLTESYVANAEMTVELLQMILPGLILMAGQLFAYLAVCFFVLTVRAARYDALLPETRWVLYPTQITCIVFLAAAFLYLITSFFVSNPFAVVIFNLLLVLWPSMAACGVRGLFVRIRHPFLRKRTLFILALFVIFGFLFAAMAVQLAAIVLAFLGAKDVLTLRMAESEMRKKNQ